MPAVAAADATAGDAHSRFNGIWIGHLERRAGDTGDPGPPPLSVDDGSPIPYQPWNEALHRAAEEKGRQGRSPPGNNQRCLPAGMMRAMRGNYPWRLIVDSRQVTLLFEEDGRLLVIPFAQSHRKNLPLTWNGDAIARWRGDTLLIDMTAFNGKTPLPYGIQITTRMHMTHELQLSADGRQLMMRTLIDDAGAFTRPFHANSTFDRWQSDYKFLDYRCAENNQDLPAGLDWWSADWGPQ